MTDKYEVERDNERIILKCHGSKIHITFLEIQEMHDLMRNEFIQDEVSVLDLKILFQAFGINLKDDLPEAWYKDFIKECDKLIARRTTISRTCECVACGDKCVLKTRDEEWMPLICPYGAALNAEWKESEYLE